MSPKLKAIGVRFLKGFLAGAFSMAATTVTAFTTVNSWTGLQMAISVVALSFTIGGLTGLIMAGEKYFTWTDSPPPQA